MLVILCCSMLHGLCIQNMGRIRCEYDPCQCTIFMIRHPSYQDIHHTCDFGYQAPLLSHAIGEIGDAELPLKRGTRALRPPPHTSYTTVQCFASWLSTGKSKWAVALKCLIRLGCLEQRQAVYIATSTSCLLPVSARQPTCKALYM